MERGFESQRYPPATLIYTLSKALGLVPDSLSEWSCGQCSLSNSISYVQCEVCSAVNTQLKELLDVLSAPYKMRDLASKLWTLATGTGGEKATLLDFLESKTGYQSISESWKCGRCGSYGQIISCVMCSNCRETNENLRKVLAFAGLNYKLKIEEKIEEDELLPPLTQVLKEVTGLLPDFKTWDCPFCEVNNPAGYVQCQECLEHNKSLYLLSTALKTPTNCVTGLKKFFNHSLADISDVPFLQKRFEETTRLTPPYQVWSCEQCSLFNSYEFYQCRLCRLPNRNLKAVLEALNRTPKPRTTFSRQIKEVWFNVVDTLKTTICPICELKIPEIDVLPLTACRHTFHPDCFRSYVLVQTTDRRFPILCPMTGCETEIVISDITSRLSHNETETFHRGSLEHYIAGNKGSVRVCPTPDCTYAFEFSGDEAFTCLLCRKSYCLQCQSLPHPSLTCDEFRLLSFFDPEIHGEMVDCPRCRIPLPHPQGNVSFCAKCSLTYCTKCHVPYHKNVSCIEFLRSRTVQAADAAFLQYMKLRPFKMCGKCGACVEKTSGCNHITCRCTYQFCYICGKDWLLGECYSHQFS